MRVTRGHFLILGSLVGAVAVAIGAIAVDLTAPAPSHILGVAIILLCVVSPIFGLAFAWAAPIRHEQGPDDRH